MDILRVAIAAASIILGIFIAQLITIILMGIREFPNAGYDGDYHIKVFTVEG